MDARMQLGSSNENEAAPGAGLGLSMGLSRTPHTAELRKAFSPVFKRHEPEHHFSPFPASFALKARTATPSATAPASATAGAGLPSPAPLALPHPRATPSTMGDNSAASAKKGRRSSRRVTAMLSSFAVLWGDGDDDDAAAANGKSSTESQEGGKDVCALADSAAVADPGANHDDVMYVPIDSTDDVDTAAINDDSNNNYSSPLGNNHAGNTSDLCSAALNAMPTVACTTDDAVIESKTVSENDNRTCYSSVAIALAAASAAADAAAAAEAVAAAEAAAVTAVRVNAVQSTPQHSNIFSAAPSTPVRTRPPLAPIATATATAAATATQPMTVTPAPALAPVQAGSLLASAASATAGAASALYSHSSPLLRRGGAFAAAAVSSAVSSAAAAALRALSPAPTPIAKPTVRGESAAKRKSARRKRSFSVMSPQPAQVLTPSKGHAESTISDDEPLSNSHVTASASTAVSAANALKQ